MRLQDVLTLTQASLSIRCPAQATRQAILAREVGVAFAADLMSDVLCYDVSRGLLITGLINPQIVRTAEMADVSAILMVRDKKPLPETIQLAEETDIPLMGTPITMFEACGRLYAAGLSPAPRQDDPISQKKCW
jgi:hypothetical protein